MYLCIHKDCSAMSDSLQPHGLEPARLLFSWNFSSKNSRVGCHFQLQGIFPTQGWNPSLFKSPALAGSSLPLVPPGKPRLNFGST